MPDTRPEDADDSTPPANEPTEDELPEDEPPDESTLMGKAGVEEEVLAELARAEAEMSKPEDGDDDEDESEGAEV